MKYIKEKRYAKYHIWDNNILVPAYKRKPKDPRAELIGARTIQEGKLGLHYFIPARWATEEI